MPLPHPRLPAILAGIALFTSLASSVQSETPSADPARIEEDLKFLSDDALAGRGVGTPELERAAEYIANRFHQLGLRDQLYDGTPFQSFAFDTQLEVDPNADNHLAFRPAGRSPVTLTVGEQYNPLSMGANGSGAGDLVFAGYGITSRELAYDDYAGIDVKGKVVLVLRKEPPFAPFGKPQPSAHAFFSTKAVNAAAHRAAALIVVNDSRTVRAAENQDAMMGVEEAGRGTARGFKTPVFFALRQPIDAMLKQMIGKGLDELEQQIAESHRPVSVELPNIQAVFSQQLRRDQMMSKNVLAELPGSGELAQETVVLGAHYDHVGMGGIGSLAPGTIAVHNGADDNASGTTSLLEAARLLTERVRSADAAENRRRIVFIAFTGEERGLLGSAHYVKAPRWPLEETVAMVNLDMVGRLLNDRLTVYGVGSGTVVGPVVRAVCQAHPVVLDEEPSGYGPSDHQSFYEKGVPVLHFFTGLHNDYHRPSDDFEKINLSGLTRITDIVSEVVWSLAVSSERPVYQKTGPGGDMRQQPRAVLGVTLKGNAAEPGAVIERISPGSPAEKAGLQVGDRVTAVDGLPVETPERLRGRIEAAGVGQTVKVTFDRNGQSLDLEVRLVAASNDP